MSKMLIVTIGRDVPMDGIVNDTTKLTLNHEAWAHFKKEIYTAVVSTFGETFERVLRWDNTQLYEGEFEESTMFQIMLDDNTSTQLIKKFVDKVGEICRKFHQEAVFIGIGSGDVFPLKDKD